MAADTWYSRAVPILEVVGEVEGSLDLLESTDLADKAGLDHAAVVVEVQRLLQGGYLCGNWESIGSGGMLVDPALAPEGARAVGRWPSREPYEALMALLERKIAEAPDEPTRSKWHRIKETFIGLSGDVGTNLLASLLFEVGKAVP